MGRPRTVAKRLAAALSGATGPATAVPGPELARRMGCSGASGGSLVACARRAGLAIRSRRGVGGYWLEGAGEAAVEDPAADPAAAGFWRMRATEPEEYLSRVVMHVEMPGGEFAVAEMAAAEPSLLPGTGKKRHLWRGRILWREADGAARVIYAGKGSAASAYAAIRKAVAAAGGRVARDEGLGAWDQL